MFKNKIEGMLPFLDEEEVYNLAKSAIMNDNSKISVSSLLPFLKDKHTDEIFFLALNEDKYNMLNNMAPFVSDEALDKLVDEYISGKYEDLNLDSLYPFMSKSSIKKLFNYMITK